MELGFDILLTRCADSGWWVATVPELPGCITQGATREDARANVREAIGLLLEDGQDHSAGGSDFGGYDVELDVTTGGWVGTTVPRVQGVPVRAESADEALAVVRTVLEAEGARVMEEALAVATDDLRGELSFDPVEFARPRPGESERDAALRVARDRDGRIRVARSPGNVRVLGLREHPIQARVDLRQHLELERPEL